MVTSRATAVLNFVRGKYRPEDFIIPGQDNNGLSSRVGCRVIPLTDRAMDILLNSRRFPFRTKGDMIRWCVTRGVEALDAMEPVTGSVLVQAEAMIKIMMDEQTNHTFLTVFQTMTVTIGMHIQAQALGEARRVISEMQTQIGKMESGYWRERYLKELDNKFGYLLKDAGGASMNEFEDHGDAEIDND